MDYFLHILIPAYGRSPFLRETILSILNSEFDKDIKVTVVDDASPDREIIEIVEEFKDLVFFERNAINLGVGGNFKKCHEISEGQLTLIIGSDDRLLPGAVSALRKAFLKFPDSIMYQLGTVIIDRHGKRIHPLVDKTKKLLSPKHSSAIQIGGSNFIRSLLIGNWLYFPASAWNSKSSTKLNWNSRYQLAVDLDLLLDLAISGERFCLLAGDQFEYRRHDGSVSSVMIDSGDRLIEELDVHANALNKLSGIQKFSLGFFAILAPTIRLHGLMAALGLFSRSPQKAIRLFLKVFSVKPFVFGK